MVHLKEFQRDGKFLLSIVDKEDDKPQSGSCFQIYRSLRRSRVNQAPAIEPSSFPSKFSIRVEKGAEDGSVGYFLQNILSRQVQPSHWIPYARAPYYIRAI